MRRSRGLVVAVLVVLAGCSGFAGGQPSTPTVTPAPIPENGSATTPRADYPPGMTSSGIRDPLRLARVHSSRLDNRSYTVVKRRAVRTGDGTLREETVTRAMFSRNRTRFHITYSVAGPDVDDLDASPATLTLWSDGDRLLQAVERDGRTTYDAYPAELFGQRPVAFDDRPYGFIDLNELQEIRLLLSVVGTSIERVARTGGVHFTVTDTGLRRPGLFAELENVTDPRNVTVTAGVRRDGLVRSYHLEYDATVDGQPIHVVRSVRYVDVGSTRIVRPDWYDEALGPAPPNRTRDPSHGG